MKWPELSIKGIFSGCVGLLILLTGCSPGAPQAVETTAARTATLALTPFQTPTVSAPTATRSPQNSSQLNLQPTATPFVHTIVAEDTLLGIAFTYGVQVEDILAANPGIDPRLLSIGMTITIPLAEDGTAVLPTAEPLPVELQEPLCYRTASGGAWCFVLARNTLDVPVESLTAQLALLDPAGEVIATQQAATPINLIPAGEALPVYGYFNPPLPDELLPLVELVSAFPATSTSERYVALAGDAPQISMLQDGLEARIQGELQVVDDNAPAGRIRLAAIGYTAEGQVAGVRLWEHQQPLQPGERLAYDFVLFSLGEQMERVEVFAEGRP